MEASILAILGCLAAGGAEPGWLDRHDLVWELPPTAWNTGIPLGNGRIGALVWGDGNPLKITLDKYDAWENREKPLDGLTYAKLREMVKEGRKEEAEACMRTEKIYGDAPFPTRLPMPRAELDFGKPFEWVSARLRLSTATVELEGRVDGAPVRVILAVLAEQNALVVRIEGAAAAGAQLRVSHDHLDSGAKATLKKWGYADPETVTTASGGSLHQKTPSGYEYAVSWDSTGEPNKKLIGLALLSSAEANGPVREAAQRLAKQTVDSKLDLGPHREWWSDYWKRSYLTVPDARFEALYYAEMYKLGCSSRAGGLPITLQGVWTLDGGLPPWSGDYHLDMNVQQTYWPIYAANRLDLGEPLYRTFSECIPRWRKQCQEFFGFDGIWSGCAIGPKGERIFGYSGVELWPGNAAWLAHNYWLHYLYSQDKQFLKEHALPMVRLSFLTYANLLEPGADGKLHVPFSYSPEYYEGGFKAYAQDPNCDLALIRFLGGAILEANRALGSDDELTPRVKEVLSKLVDYPQRNGRLFVSADQPLEHSHRHHSHLMAIHPLALITPEGDEQQKRIIKESLLEIRTLGTGQWTGWAFPWMSLIASRSGYPNMAWQMLDTYANAFIKPNTFHVNGDPRIFGLSLFDYEPMTLEAGFGAAAAIQEMLIQSQNGVIRLFPAVPDRWHDAYFRDLRAAGAFVVTSRLQNGMVAFVRIRSEVGGPCRVKNCFGGNVSLRTRGKQSLLTGDTLEFETQAGTEYVLCREGQAMDETAPAFERSPGELNFYGVKRQPRF